MSALTEFLAEVHDRSRRAADFAHEVGNDEDQSYAWGVGDFAGYLLARIAGDLDFQMNEDHKSLMRATNGQLAEVLLFGDGEE